MKQTKLIFVEGIPGSGKSSTAQYLSRVLDENGIAHKWWYEEDQDHPVYFFHDRETMQEAIDDLTSGNYRRVITKALRRWEEFIAGLQASGEIIVVDSCLFGYVTWSLFANNVPEPVIHEYLAEVERIAGTCSPQVIYLYQNDVEKALETICTRRNMEQVYIRNAADSLYGQKRGLSGFPGMVSYWKDYRVVADEAYGRIGFSKLAIENSEGDWPTYYANILEFLELDAIQEDMISREVLLRLAGDYSVMGGAGQECSVLLEEDRLIVDGLPGVWKRTALIPRSSRVFDVQSLPFRVEFEEDEAANVTRMHLLGTVQLEGAIDSSFTKVCK